MMMMMSYLWTIIDKNNTTSIITTMVGTENDGLEAKKRNDFVSSLFSISISSRQERFLKEEQKVML
jgi:hypothetical protein